MKHFFKFVILIFLFFIQACPAENVIQPASPQPVSSKSANPSPVTSAEPVQKVGSLTVIVKDGLTMLPLPNATAHITSAGGINISSKTDFEGKVILNSLVEGHNYTVEVSATGYLFNSSTTASSNLEIKSESPQILTINLFKSFGTLKGKIVSSDGFPVDSAIVKAGNNYGITSSNGAFNVSVTNLTNLPVSVYKIGFTSFDFGYHDFSKESNFDTGEIRIQKKLIPPVILFETSKKPFGDNINRFDRLQDLLSTNGYKILTGSISEMTSLSEIDAIVIACPSSDYSPSEIEKISNFAKSGKKLVFLGEWGGFGGFKVGSVNNLLKEANIEINIDIVKETITENMINNNDEQIMPTTFTSHYLTKGISKLAFYSSASVQIIDGNIKSLDTNQTKLLIFSSSSSFRIESYLKGQVGFVGVSLLGAGKVIVSGDSSIFTNNDSDNDSVINLEEFDNKQLALNIFSW